MIRERGSMRSKLTAFTKQETEIIKQFLSKTDDIYRAAYGRRTKRNTPGSACFSEHQIHRNFKRRDRGRRFWPVDVGLHPVKEICMGGSSEGSRPDLGGGLYILAAGRKTISYEGRGSICPGGTGGTPGDLSKRGDYPGLPGKEDPGKLEYLRFSKKKDVLERPVTWNPGAYDRAPESVCDGDLGGMLRRRSTVYAEKG